MLSFNEVFVTGLYLKLRRQYFCGVMEKFHSKPEKFMLSTVNSVKLIIEGLVK